MKTKLMNGLQNEKAFQPPVLSSETSFELQVSQQPVPPLGASICRSVVYNSAWGVGGANPDALLGLVASLSVPTTQWSWLIHPTIECKWVFWWNLFTLYYRLYSLCRLGLRHLESLRVSVWSQNFVTTLRLLMSSLLHGKGWKQSIICDLDQRLTLWWKDLPHQHPTLCWLLPGKFFCYLFCFKRASA